MVSVVLLENQRIEEKFCEGIEFFSIRENAGNLRFSLSVFFLNILKHFIAFFLNL